jgi:hypothetical protein
VADCGADRCVTPPDGGKPFCALDTSASPVCSGGVDFACAGNALVECNAGYRVGRALGKTCDTSAGGCDLLLGTCLSGSEGATCKGDADCASGLTCALDREPATCELACACPEGTACASCDVLLESAPGDGEAPVWVCSAGRCALSFP